MPPKQIKPGQRIAFTLTRRERDLIIRAAAASGSRLGVQLTLDDVDDLAGHVAAAANHCAERQVRQALEAVYDHLADIEARFTDEEAGPIARAEGLKAFTVKQGQYLAFVYYYSKIHGMPPAESDFQRFFRVTPPVVHQMIKTLHTRGFVDREPGKARSIELRLTRAQLPDLE